MKSIVKLVGISSCCIALGGAAANADPVPLADAELDRVAAGLSCASAAECPYPPGSPFLPRWSSFELQPGQPIAFDLPQRLGSPGSFNPSPTPAPVIEPLTFSFGGFGGCGGPATLCAGPTGPAFRL